MKAGFTDFSISAGIAATPWPKGTDPHVCRLVCRYHGWSYSLDGTLVHAPDANGEVGFDAGELGLRRMAVWTSGTPLCWSTPIPVPHRNRPTRYFYVCKEELVRYGRKTCQTMRGDLVDAEISRFVIDTLNRKNNDLALAVQHQVDVEFAEADAQRARRIEAFRYEADLARRRFFEVDPANRLVAASLEADWNERLCDLEEACREREARGAVRDTELSERQVDHIRELARDFERVWNAAQTGNADRKRLLGILIEDATLTRDGSEVTIGLRMRGGRSLTLDPLHLPRPMADIRKTPAETVAALDRLLETHGDEGAACELNAMGCRNWKGESFTAKRVGGNTAGLRPAQPPRA